MSNVLLVYGTVLSIYIIYLYYIIYIYIKYIKHDLFLSLYICFDKYTVLRLSIIIIFVMFLC